MVRGHHVHRFREPDQRKRAEPPHLHRQSGGRCSRTYVTDGTPEQRQETRRKAFNRAIKDAPERSLIAVYATTAETFMWFTETPA